MESRLYEVRLVTKVQECGVESQDERPEAGCKVTEQQEARMTKNVAHGAFLVYPWH
jgi:hypothetical protein